MPEHTVSKLVCRQAGPADAHHIVALVESAYRGEHSRQGWTTEADFLDGQRLDIAMAREMLADPAQRVVLAFDPALGSEPVGTVTIADEGERVAYFGTFAIAPEQQGRGLGRALMDWAEALAAREFGARTMRMTVISRRSELIAFYERRGYVRTGETEPFPYGHEQFGLPKVDDLEFAVLIKPLPGGADAGRAGDAG